MACNGPSNLMWTDQYIGTCANDYLQLSSVMMGLLSICFWVIAQAPQIYLNYKISSADSLSFTFLCIWIAGDIMNLTGSVLTSQLPTQIYVAAYYVSVDAVLTSQYLYYYYKNKDKKLNEKKGYVEVAGEPPAVEEPSGICDPGSLPRASPAIAAPRRSFAPTLSGAEAACSPLTNPIIPPPGVGRRSRATSRADYSSASENTPLLLPNTESTVNGSHGPSKGSLYAVLAVAMVSAGGMGVAALTGGTALAGLPAAGMAGSGGRVLSTLPSVDGMGFGVFIGEVLGWASAGTYLCSRIPQLLMNYRSKSTEGLSPVLFTMAFLGNVTYAASIFLYATDAEFIIAKLPWLVGSLGTLVFDGVMLSQFFIFGGPPEDQDLRGVGTTGRMMVGDGTRLRFSRSAGSFIDSDGIVHRNRTFLRRHYYGRLGFNTRRTPPPVMITTENYV